MVRKPLFKWMSYDKHRTIVMEYRFSFLESKAFPRKLWGAKIAAWGAQLPL